MGLQSRSVPRKGFSCSPHSNHFIYSVTFPIFFRPNLSYELFFSISSCHLSSLPGYPIGTLFDYVSNQTCILSCLSNSVPLLCLLFQKVVPPSPQILWGRNQGTVLDSCLLSHTFHGITAPIHLAINYQVLLSLFPKTFSIYCFPSPLAITNVFSVLQKVQHCSIVWHIK